MVFPTLKYEEELFKKGCKFVCGIDEVGRGPLAGPVVAGAVVLSEESRLPEGVADSKLLKPYQREELAEKIKKLAVAWAVAKIGVGAIDRFGINKATQMAFTKAVRRLSVAPDHFIIDAFYIEGIDRGIQTPVVKGDQLCASIAAASIIAKVYRDDFMDKLHQTKDYSKYAWNVNRGYGTPMHLEAIRKYGLCNIHRKSFNLDRYL